MMLRFIQLTIILTFVVLITFLPALDFMPMSISYHDGQRLIEVGLLGLVLLYNAFGRFNNAHALQVEYKMRVGLLLLFALAIISALLALSPRHAIIEVNSFVGLAFLALFVAGLYHQHKSIFIKWLSTALLASAVLYMVAFFSGYISSYFFPDPLFWPFPLYNFDNVRSFNQYQLWIIAIVGLPLLTVEFKKSSTRYWLYVALACWWVLLFYSASRGVLVAWVVGLLVTAIAYRQLAWPLLRLQMISATTGLISYGVLFKVLPTLLKESFFLRTALRSSTDDRIALWSQAIMLIKKFPYFGTGPMHFPWYNRTLAHPHNSVLQIAAEWGLIATFIILAMVAYATFCWLNKINTQTLKTASSLDKQLAIIIFFTLVTNAAYSMVDGVIVMPISQVLMFTMIGLAIGYYVDFNTLNANAKRILTLRPLLATVVLILFAWSIFPEISANYSGSKYHFSMGYMAGGPRFWVEYKDN
ncbi:MAG: O-antigen ligase family protein [Methylophilaceae bacterium]